MSRYFQYGFQPRYAFNWNAGQGGVMSPTRPASSLGNASMIESGYNDPNYEHYPAFNTVRARECKIPQPKPCGLRAIASLQLAGLGDLPLLRRQGFEPDPMGAIPIWDGLSSGAKLAVVGAAALGALWWVKRRKPGRRNPWAVTSSSRGVRGTLRFTSKKRAKDYADYLVKAKLPAKVHPYKRHRKRK